MKNLVKLFSLLFIMTGVIGFAQGTVSGSVTDSDGLPLPGATVVVQGTSIGVTSDFDGNCNFSISRRCISFQLCWVYEPICYSWNIVYCQCIP